MEDYEFLATLRTVENIEDGGNIRLMCVTVENAKDTLCRNVLIYGHCRYEEQGPSPYPYP